jgi:hypothetical protein
MEEKLYGNWELYCHLYMELKYPSNPCSASVVRSTRGLRIPWNVVGWHVT